MTIWGQGGNEGWLPHYELVMEVVLFQDAEAAVLHV